MDLNQAYYDELWPERCPVCFATYTFKPCDSCKVVRYCGHLHARTDQPNHQSTCTKIRKTREKLEEEERKLRSLFLPNDVFTDHVGGFWELPEARSYMMARCDAVKALMEVNTLSSVEQALEHCNTMLRLCRNDDMRMRSYAAPLFLRLGQEQECYDFLDLCCSGAVSSNGKSNYSVRNLPALHSWNADAFEPVDKFRLNANILNLTLSQFATLTLLKLRLFLDLQALEQRLDSMWKSMAGNVFSEQKYGGPLDRPLGQIADTWVQESPNRPNISEMAERIKAQYLNLCEWLHHANGHFWEALINTETPALPTCQIKIGSREEADMSVFHCKRSWEESEGALAQIKADTSQWVVQRDGLRGGVTSTGGSHVRRPVDVTTDVPIRRGTGKVFASEFVHPTPGTTPGKLFNLNSPADGGADRFLRRDQPRSVLVYTGGACVETEEDNARGGWAVVYGPGKVASGSLEEEGPFGKVSLNRAANSNQAKLRAVIAALRLCDWRGDGFNNITIATDSTYVVKGATTGIKTFTHNGRVTGTRQDVEHTDLWDALQGEVHRWAERGVSVDFWNIPAKWNTKANIAAKRAISKAPVAPVREWKDVTIHSGPAKVQIIVLCLEHEDLLDVCFGSFLKRIGSKAQLLRVTTPEQALQMLSLEKRPSTMLVTDAAITRNREVFRRVADYLSHGATVVLCGLFSSMVQAHDLDSFADDFGYFFAQLGLDWRRGKFRRYPVSLRDGAVGDQLADQLPNRYHPKAVFVRDIPTWSNESVYSEVRDLRYQSWRVSPEAAVAFTKVGQGMLGYIGDVNGEEESTTAVMAMCGLLDCDKDVVEISDSDHDMSDVDDSE